MKAPNTDKASKFHFTLPPVYDSSLSPILRAAIQLGALTSRLTIEPRTHCFIPDGRAENVAEHSHMLSLVAAEIAAAHFPQYDANLCARFGTIHDLVEAYVKDTPTYNISDQGLRDKAALEAEGLKQLLKDYAHLPSFCEMVNRYEEQKEPEARFVRMIDKWMTLLIHLYNDGLQLKGLTNNAEMQAATELTYKRLFAEYPDQEEVLRLRNELAEYLVRVFFTDK